MPNKQSKFFKPKFKIVKKKCEFEGCEEVFDGIIMGKYCPEHRKQKYRKIIDKDKTRIKKEEIISNNVNQIIKHKYKKSQVITGTCQLEGCGRNFDILLVPNTYTYPRFCEEHRNDYKRERFLANGR